MQGCSGKGLTKEEPLKLWGIVDEAAVRRVVGGPEVMREQLDYLLTVTELPTVQFQVLPFDAGAHPGMTGSFVVMGFAEVVGPDIVYIDSQAGISSWKRKPTLHGIT